MLQAKVAVEELVLAPHVHVEPLEGGEERLFFSHSPSAAAAAAAALVTTLRRWTHLTPELQERPVGALDLVRLEADAVLAVHFEGAVPDGIKIYPVPRVDNLQG